ncbi:hypothetical protein HF521_021289 [Silurus meridionalis]|uniref:Uncharacterized protein n=1 Tax=Silurus meridionalis TaxID=175797 RepID=A0A8T0BED1_SILME|nr:hypothetical protein HF521_021289 [Silurus meridionalis]
MKILQELPVEKVGGRSGTATRTQPRKASRVGKPKNILFPGEDDDSEMEGHQKEPNKKKGRYSIPDAPKIARQHKLDPGKPSCPKHCHSTPDLPIDEMKRIKGTKSRKRWSQHS